MTTGKINLITPPDTIFNQNFNYLLVKPSTNTKMQFQTLLSQQLEDINVFIYDQDEHDIVWLLNVAQQADIIILEIDNCDSITKQFVSLLLSYPATYYITQDGLTPWHLISRNRIYNLDWITEFISEKEDDDNDESEN